MAHVQHDRSKIHIVKNGAAVTPVRERRKFASGEAVPKSGIYSVVHRQHRLPHEVTMLAGQMFPACGKWDQRSAVESLRTADE
jgi:hypothetical protein